jgi:hypothetical protein
LDSRVIFVRDETRRVQQDRRNLELSVLINCINREFIPAPSTRAAPDSFLYSLAAEPAMGIEGDIVKCVERDGRAVKRKQMIGNRGHYCRKEMTAPIMVLVNTGVKRRCSRDGCGSARVQLFFPRKRNAPSAWLQGSSSFLHQRNNSFTFSCCFREPCRIYSTPSYS